MPVEDGEHQFLGALIDHATSSIEAKNAGVEAGGRQMVRGFPAISRCGRATYDRCMSQRRDVDRFDRWAESYDRHWMQRRIFEPVQRTVLEVASLEIARPAAILDVGCGTGRLLRSAEARFPGTRLEGVDAAPEMVRQAEASIPAGSAVHVRQAVAEQLPFPNDQFDLVFSTLTFHHWRDQARAVAEVGRVLAPGGRWLLADFVANGFMKFVRWLFRMKRFPARRQLGVMLSAANLEIVGERQVPGLGGQVTVLAIGERP